MVTFSLSDLTWRSTLRQRRILALARRLAIACCAGITVFATLQCIVASVQTQPVVIAARRIVRGAQLRNNDVKIVQVPVSTIWSGALTRAEEVTGQIAQVELARGQPILQFSIAERPVLPNGHTTIDVRLSSSSDRLIAGDLVDLVTNMDCVATATPDTSTSEGNNTGGQENTEEGTNTHSNDDQTAGTPSSNTAHSTDPHSSDTQSANASQQDIAASHDSAAAGNDTTTDTTASASPHTNEQDTLNSSTDASEQNSHIDASAQNSANNVSEPKHEAGTNTNAPNTNNVPNANVSSTDVTHSNTSGSVTDTTTTQGGSDKTAVDNDANTTTQHRLNTCTLASAALTMDTPHEDALTGSTVVSLAMLPEDAMAVIAMQETGAIMAVSRTDK